MEKAKIGIVGSKFAAMLHAESYKRCAEAEMIAVAAIDNLNEFADVYLIPNRYTNYQEMFDRENVDMISVCVPNYLHKEVVLAAAETGIQAIICEKPLATNLVDGVEMIQTCQQKQIKLMYAEDWLFAPALVRAKQICEQGGIGDILYIKAKETHNGSHSIFAQKKEYCGGGAMIHLGIHPIGFLPWMVGSEIVEVLGMTSEGGENNLLHRNYTGEDWSAALLNLKNGVRGLVEGNYITCGGMDDKVEIYGTDGNIHIDLTKGSPIKVYSRPGYDYAVEKADFTHGWTSPAVDELLSLGYIPEIKGFVNCVMKNQPPPEGTKGEDGLQALAVALAIYQSAEQKRLVKVNEIFTGYINRR